MEENACGVGLLFFLIKIDNWHLAPCFVRTLLTRKRNHENIPCICLWDTQALTCIILDTPIFTHSFMKQRWWPSFCKSTMETAFPSLLSNHADSVRFLPCVYGIATIVADEPCAQIIVFVRSGIHSSSPFYFETRRNDHAFG